MGQVFIQFLWLGCVSFGGPAAHIGYFQRAFVERLGWLTQAEFAQLLALCQLLPGPASSQLGFAIGRQRAGLGGALAAFAGFTLPSFLLLLAAAIGVGQLTANVWLDAALHGLKLLALVVVADAVLTISRQFCKTALAQGIMVATAAALWWQPGLLTQLVMLAGAVTGINAAVVGLLLAAFYQPVWQSAVQVPTDLALAAVGFYLLRVLKLPILALAGLLVGAAMLLA